MLRIPYVFIGYPISKLSNGTDKVLLLIDKLVMNTYRRHRFRPDIISHAVWLYHRFNLSCRDVEDLLAERGISVSYETIRLWCIKFGTRYARRLKQRHRGYGDTFYIDEVFVKINGKQQYLWRAVDQDGEVVDVYLQARRDGAAAKRFFKRLMRSCGGEPRNIVTDKMRSYGVAHRELMPDVVHNAARYANNRAEQSHESTRVRERGRHLVRAKHYRILRISAFKEWKAAVAW